MSVKLLVDIWNSDLETNKKFVLMVYADFSDDKGQNTFPSLGTIAKKTGLSVATVRRTVKSLVEDGLLVFKGISHLGTTMYSIGGGITMVGGYQHDTQYTDLINSVNLKSGSTMVPPPTNMTGDLDEFGFPIAEGEKETGDLSDAFTKATSINAYDLERWIKSCQNMTSNKVTKEIMIEAIQVLRSKNFSISGPWSVDKTAISIASQRNGVAPGEMLQVDENGRIL